MKIIGIKPNQVISMNDYPPLHSPNALRKYHIGFKQNNLSEITPIPIIPVSIVAPYLQKHDSRFATYKKQLDDFLKKHPKAKYFMIDGTHRAAGAMLSVSKIPACLIKTDMDIKELSQLKEAGKITMTGLEPNLPKTMDVIEEHYHRTQKFWTLEEKVKAMIANDDIDKDIVAYYRQKIVKLKGE